MNTNPHKPGLGRHLPARRQGYAVADLRPHDADRGVLQEVINRRLAARLSLSLSVASLIAGLAEIGPEHRRPGR